MNTRILMSVSAMVMMAAGIVLNFFPQEIVIYASATTDSVREIVALQLLGAAYFAFGMVNWTARANLIGGIYGRSISIGNLTHFTIGALALIKAYWLTRDATLLPFMITYSVFALSFMYVFFTHPLREQATGS
jgi:hypothetical protein